MKTLSTISLLTALLLFMGCDETKKVIDVAGTVQLSGNYTVTEAGDTAVNSEDVTFSLAALDKSISGNTGCNSFFGNYTIDLYAMSFGDLAVSEKYCDKDIMNTERRLLNALNNTGSYALQDGVLTLYSKTDRSVLLKATKENNTQN